MLKFAENAQQRQKKKNILFGDCRERGVYLRGGRKKTKLIGSWRRALSSGAKVEAKIATSEQQNNVVTSAQRHNANNGQRSLTRRKYDTDRKAHHEASVVNYFIRELFDAICGSIQRGRELRIDANSSSLQ